MNEKFPDPYEGMTDDEIEEEAFRIFNEPETTVSLTIPVEFWEHIRHWPSGAPVSQYKNSWCGHSTLASSKSNTRPETIHLPAKGSDDIAKQRKPGFRTLASTDRTVGAPTAG